MKLNILFVSGLWLDMYTANSRVSTKKCYNRSKVDILKEKTKCSHNNAQPEPERERKKRASIINWQNSKMANIKVTIAIINLNINDLVVLVKK